MNLPRQGLAVLLLALAGFGITDLLRSRGGDDAPTALAASPLGSAGTRAPEDAGEDLVRPLAALSTGDDIAPEGAARSARPVLHADESPPAPPLVSDDPVEPFFAGKIHRAKRQVPRRSLGGRVRQLLVNDHLKRAAVGLAVFSVTHGESLLRVDASTPRIPASNTKLVTTAAALATLGRDFAFETRLVGTARIVDGVLDGDLVVVGDGDPDPRQTDGPSLSERLVSAAKSAGLRRVTGRLVVDDRLFDREGTARGWKTKNLKKAYAAPVAGFSARGNTMAVEIEPASTVGGAARVSIDPPGGPFAVSAEVKTVGRGGDHIIDVRPMPVEPGPVRVRGKTPHGAKPVPVEVSIATPAIVAGHGLRSALVNAGVEIVGDVVLATRGTPIGHEDVPPLATVRSPLMPLLSILNKHSSNVVAEHLFKRCGFAREGIGSFASGARASRAALERFGVVVGASVAADGSGLSRENRYSADVFCLLLDRLYRSDARDMLVDSLAVAGVDGTMRRRLTGPRTRGRVRAKTGYVTKVSAVSGYAQTDEGEVVAFSILMNDFTGWVGHVKQVQDRIMALLLDLEGR